MAGVSEAPGRDPATLSPRELREFRQEVGMTLAQVRELNARLEEEETLGFTLFRLAERWAVSRNQAKDIILSTGIAPKLYGAKRVWDKRHLAALDAAWRAKGKPDERWGAQT